MKRSLFLSKRIYPLSNHVSGAPVSTLSFLQRDYRKEFVEAMDDAGITFKEEIIADGVIHRFSPKEKGNKDGWYVFYGMAGAFGDWSQDVWRKWSLKNQSLLLKDKEIFAAHLQKAHAAAYQERQFKNKEVSELALEKWNSLSETGESPYLSKKRLDGFGVRFKDNLLIIPLRDISGHLWSLQWINPDGTKIFLRGGRKKGCFHSIGSIEDGKPIIVCEGYATGTSIYMATQISTVIAFDSGNLESVIEELKKVYPQSPFLIAGDDDVSKELNVGRKKAEEAAQKYHCSVVFPKFKNRDTKPSDFNDLHVLEGLQVVRTQINNSVRPKTLKALTIKELLSMEIPPREMILGPIIPEQGITMLHAPRGIGKTHVALMIAYAVATGKLYFPR